MALTFGQASGGAWPAWGLRGPRDSGVRVLRRVRIQPQGQACRGGGGQLPAHPGDAWPFGALCPPLSVPGRESWGLLPLGPAEAAGWGDGAEQVGPRGCGELWVTPGHLERQGPHGSTEGERPGDRPRWGTSLGGGPFTLPQGAAEPGCCCHLVGRLGAWAAAQERGLGAPGWLRAVPASAARPGLAPSTQRPAPSTARPGPSPSTQRSQARPGTQRPAPSAARPALAPSAQHSVQPGPAQHPAPGTQRSQARPSTQHPAQPDPPQHPAPGT